MKLETRFVSLFGSNANAEIRLAPGDDPNRFVGLIPFLSLSVDLGGFRERLLPSAFRSTLAGNEDVRALVDHSSEKLLGRTSNGTLRLAETAIGLEVAIDLPDTSYARDTRELVRRRDIRGLSFGFVVRGDKGQRFLKEGGQMIRELIDVSLKEVSVVGQPAYTDTSVAIRSACIDPAVIEQMRAGENSSPPDLANLRLRLLITSAER